ncbi:MAG: class I SAM-dependent methyltransferase, partial [Thermoanaerobaculia bacterium]
MDRAELHQRIHQFPQWHYQLDLGGELTPIFDKRQINRHEQRKRYFFDPLVAHLGGSLEGKRVLDLGCNAGYWSLLALQHGCDQLVAIDGRQMHIDQARLVFEVNEIDPGRYQLTQGNIFDIDLRQLGSFDIVFCLGLMYHVSKPVTLIEKIARVNSDLLIIDTSLAGLPGSLLHYKREILEDPRSGVDYDLVAYPTRRAVIDMVRPFGYTVVVPKPRFTDWEGSADYRLRKRRAFL